MILLLALKLLLISLAASSLFVLSGFLHQRQKAKIPVALLLSTGLTVSRPAVPSSGGEAAQPFSDHQGVGLRPLGFAGHVVTSGKVPSGSRS